MVIQKKTRRGPAVVVPTKVPKPGQLRVAKQSQKKPSPQRKFREIASQDFGIRFFRYEDSSRRDWPKAIPMGLANGMCQWVLPSQSALVSSLQHRVPRHRDLPVPVGRLFHMGDRRERIVEA